MKPGAEDELDVGQDKLVSTCMIGTNSDAWSEGTVIRCGIVDDKKGED